MANKRLWLIAAVVVPPALLLLYLVPPGEETFYPRCFFHLVTGLHCPGCGGTRCVHALLHGDLAQAAAYNLLVVLALPLLAAWGLWAGYNQLRGRPVAAVRLRGWSVCVLVGLLLAYWVLRNLPFEPFNLLAPHTL